MRMPRSLAIGSAAAALMAVPVAGATSAAAVTAAPAVAGAPATAHRVVGPNHIRGLHGAHRFMIVTAPTMHSTHALVRRYDLGRNGRYHRTGGVAHARVGLAGLSHPRQRHTATARPRWASTDSSSASAASRIPA
jgi:hypothetical protein